jgi:hypothetical protein
LSRGHSLALVFELFVLIGGEGPQYKQSMHVMGELDREGSPRPIPAKELQAMLGSNPAFCSWDAWNSTVSDFTTRWPFLFSYPLLGTNEGGPRNRHSAS